MKISLIKKLFKDKGYYAALREINRKKAIQKERTEKLNLSNKEFDDLAKSKGVSSEYYKKLLQDNYIDNENLIKKYEKVFKTLEKPKEKNIKFNEIVDKEVLKARALEKYPNMGEEYKKEISKINKMQKGGIVDQTKKLLQEGGLSQEGGTTDPVSGNDVPVGSTQEEVRDDIPVQLSEGEFVFPADVVRFIGLDNLMKLRQAAKEGLAKMDRMGQMGNAEEATEPDTGPFETDIDSILDEIEKEVQLENESATTN